MIFSGVLELPLCQSCLSAASRSITWPTPGTYLPIAYSRLLDDHMGEKSPRVLFIPIVSLVISCVRTPTEQALSFEVEITAEQKQAT